MSYEDQFVRYEPSVLVPDMRLMVLGMLRDAGFSVLVADKVIQCESNWNPNSVGDHGESLGLWQIHQPSHDTGLVAFDPYEATKYAIKLLQSERSWRHWSCYKNIYE